MENIQSTIQEKKEKKIKAIIAIMFDSFDNHESVKFWHLLGDRDIDINN